MSRLEQTRLVFYASSCFQLIPISEDVGKAENIVSISLGFEDGSFGTIFYLANGSSKFPKERIEVFADGKVLQLDNFRKLKGFGWSDFNKMNLFNQNKGQYECAEKFIANLKMGTCLIPAEEIFEVARVAIDVNNSLVD